MKNDKAVPDEIQPELLKWLSGDALDKLLSDLNAALATKDSLPEWKNGWISLLYKAKDPFSLDNYRPITLLPMIGKIFEGLISRRLVSICVQNHILNEFQVGFQKGKRIADITTNLIQVYSQSKLTGSPLHVLMIDFVKAYDSVSHDIIDFNLSYYGFPQEVISLIHNLHRGMTSQVKTKYGLSPSLPLDRGVRQGSPLACLIFILAINPLLDILGKSPGILLNGLHISHGAMADDVVSLQSSHQNVQDTLCLAERFCVMSGMKINQTKTTYQNNQGCASIKTESYTIMATDPHKALRYLGIWTSFDLDWSTHWAILQESTTAQLQYLSHRRLTIAQKVAIINAQIMGKLRFSMSIIHPPSNFIALLTRYTNELIRRTLGLSLSVPRKIFYLPVSCGGLGLLSLSETAEAAFLSTSLGHTMHNYDTDEPRIPAQQFFTDVANGTLSITPNQSISRRSSSGLLMSSLSSEICAAATSFKLHIRTPWHNGGLVTALPIPWRLQNKCIEHHFTELLQFPDQWPPSFTSSETQLLRTIAMSRPLATWTFTTPSLHFRQAGVIGQMSLVDSSEELWLFTDGSLKDNLAGFGASINGLSIWGRATGQPSILNAEAQAVRAALSLLPPEYKSRLFVDNETLFHYLTDFQAIAPISWEKVAFRSVMHDIKCRILSFPHLSVEWYPSHATEKLASNSKLTPKIRTLRRFWGEKYTIIESGNDHADALANLGRSLPLEDEIPTTPALQLWTDTFQIEGSISKSIRDLFTQKMINEISSLSNGFIWSCPNILWPLSALPLNHTGNRYNLLTSFMLKFRTNTLAVKALMFKISQKHHVEKVKLNALYSDPFCESCKRHNQLIPETLQHLFIDDRRAASLHAILWRKIISLIHSEIPSDLRNLPNNHLNYLPCWFASLPFTIATNPHWLARQNAILTFPKLLGMMALCPTSLPPFLSHLHIRNPKSVIKTIMLLIMRSTYKFFILSRKRLANILDISPQDLPEFDLDPDDT